MKNLFTRLPGLALLFVSLTTSAQIRRCATTEHEAQLRLNNPKREAQVQKYEQAQQVLLQASQRSQMVPVTIPVVVHVLYANNSQNISDAQILTQIEVLNTDFAHLNADSVNTPAAFASLASASNIQFCMAQRDPNGLPTNGIERRSTTTTSWNTNDNIKHFNTGGLNAWDPTRYFNIWVGKLGNLLLGYAEFPTSSVSNTYGVVITYDAFGTIGTAASPFNLGRSATHEVGHCFNLYHIWADDGGTCTGSDFVGDTPNQGSENYNCPSYPLTDNCATNNPGVMFMNYMDYVDDGCMNLFTQGQVNRINAVIATPPYNALASSNGCTPVAVTGNDAGIASITSPVNTLCTGSIAPVVVLQNYGASAINTVTITYDIDGGTPQTYSWSGALATFATTSVTLPAITVVAGAHIITVSTSLPNGTADTNPANDTQSGPFTVAGGSGAALPYSEGFENTFPAAGMVLNNPDGLYTWEQSTLAAKTGSNSILMDNYDYDASGEIDEITLPAVDLTGGSPNTVPVISFQVAYQLYTSPTANPNYSDTLELLVSTNCGATFSTVYKKFGVALTTAIPNYSTIEFIPTSTQWRKDSIVLGQFATYNNVVFKLKHITDFENSLFVDDINIKHATATGINSVINTVVNIFPNPVNDLLNLQLLQAARIELFNVAGQKVYDSVNALQAEQLKINTSKFKTGVYMLRATTARETYTTRIVKN